MCDKDPPNEEEICKTTLVDPLWLMILKSLLMIIIGLKKGVKKMFVFLLSSREKNPVETITPCLVTLTQYARDVSLDVNNENKRRVYLLGTYTFQSINQSSCNVFNRVINNNQRMNVLLPFPLPFSVHHFFYKHSLLTPNPTLTNGDYNNINKSVFKHYAKIVCPK